PAPEHAEGRAEPLPTGPRADRRAGAQLLMTAAPHIDPDDPIGRRYGSRTVIAIVSRTTSGFARIVRTLCDCGHASEHRIAYLERDPSSLRCTGCARRAVVAE